MALPPRRRSLWCTPAPQVSQAEQNKQSEKEHHRECVQRIEPGTSGAPVQRSLQAIGHCGPSASPHRPDPGDRIRKGARRKRQGDHLDRFARLLHTGAGQTEPVARIDAQQRDHREPGREEQGWPSRTLPIRRIQTDDGEHDKRRNRRADQRDRQIAHRGRRRQRKPRVEGPVLPKRPDDARRPLIRDNRNLIVRGNRTRRNHVGGKEDEEQEQDDPAHAVRAGRLLRDQTALLSRRVNPAPMARGRHPARGPSKLIIRGTGSPTRFKVHPRGRAGPKPVPPRVKVSVRRPARRVQAGVLSLVPGSFKGRYPTSEQCFGLATVACDPV